ncbi:hypothetical protein FOA43_001767 [Brettanomyces nanus]|uniref:Pre-mRNA-splicing factor CWC2 n=1 Tax=Eeniella nana TaxID=13502 RepID=A0A875S0F4_EENNA|nr:uncharacterized protein FOA43_001767 [Brettanomyces nanus]QPG74438.1 hypothetical protein FOA43_001767 [Brettanomyces nanus]
MAPRKAARVQIDPAAVNSESKPQQTGQVFNIWYSKWTGGENNGREGLVHSKTRCNVELDSGYTRADKHVAADSVNGDKYFCLYFARGCCCNGKHCEYLHRIPTEMDNLPPNVDCFGREKFMDYRDDMAGIGSFSKVNRTLYVGRISNLDGNIELELSKNFGQYGDIERIRVIKSKKIAFVTYRFENQAQFAKEAMYGQSVTGDVNEALNIRWASEDPDPSAQKRNKQEMERSALKKAQKLLEEMNRQRLKEGVKSVKESPTTDHVATDPASTNPPLLESSPSIIINTDSLSALRKLKRRKIIKKHQDSIQTPLRTILADYSSDSD